MTNQQNITRTAGNVNNWETIEREFRALNPETGDWVASGYLVDGDYQAVYVRETPDAPQRCIGFVSGAERETLSELARKIWPQQLEPDTRIVETSRPVPPVLVFRSVGQADALLRALEGRSLTDEQKRWLTYLADSLRLTCAEFPYGKWDGVADKFIERKSSDRTERILTPAECKNTYGSSDPDELNPAFEEEATRATDGNGRKYAERTDAGNIRIVTEVY